MKNLGVQNLTIISLDIFCFENRVDPDQLAYKLNYQNTYLSSHMMDKTGK